MDTNENEKKVVEKQVKEEKKERGLKRLSDGRWQFSWKYQGYYHRRIANTKTEARNYLNKIKTDIREGRYLDLKEVVHTPFEDGVQRFLNWGIANTRVSNQKLDRLCSKSWLGFHLFKGRTMDKITQGDVERYKEYLLTVRINNGTRAEGKLLSPRSVDIHLSRLKRMFNLGIEWGLCEVNPAAKVKLLRRDDKRIRYLSEEEEARLMEAATPALQKVIQFALHTGMRRGEILGLKWSDINFNTKVAIIPATRAKGKRDRVIPLNSVALAIINDVPRPLDSNELVFGNSGGGKWDRLRKHWLKAVTISKLENFRFHDLRHTYASRLVTSGVDLAVIKELLGHRDFETTLRYAHLKPERLHQAVDLLASADPKSQLSCDSEPDQQVEEKEPSVTEGQERG